MFCSEKWLHISEILHTRPYFQAKGENVCILHEKENHTLYAYQTSKAHAYDFQNPVLKLNYNLPINTFLSY